MHPMVAHESSAGTAQGSVEEQPPADVRCRWSSSSSCRSSPTTTSSIKMGVQVYDHGHSYTGVNFSIHSKYSSVPEYERSMDAGLRRGARACDSGRGTAQHGLLPEPHDQGRDSGHSRGAAARGGQDADRKLTRCGWSARRMSCWREASCTPVSSMHPLRWSATTTCIAIARSRKAWPPAATSGSACIATTQSAEATAGVAGTLQRHQRNRRCAGSSGPGSQAMTQARGASP